MRQRQAIWPSSVSDFLFGSGLIFCHGRSGFRRNGAGANILFYMTSRMEWVMEIAVHTAVFPPAHRRLTREIGYCTK